MPDIAANQDFLAGVSWESNDGLVTGMTDVLLTMTNRRTGAAIVSGQVVNESGSPGFYEVTLDDALFPSSLQGVRAVFTSAARELRHEQYLTVGVLQDWMRTRRATRFAIARRLWREKLTWMEKATTLSSTTQFKLARVVVGGKNQYRGLWARFSSGANRGLSRLVTAYDEATYTWTVAPPLPAAVATDDWVEIYPDNPDVLDSAIDEAWSELEGRRLRHVEEQVLESDGATEYFQLPTDARFVYEVSVIRGTTETTLRAAQWSLHPGGQIRLLTPRTKPHTRVADLENPMGWTALGSRPWPDGYTFKLKMLADTPLPLYDEGWIDAPTGPFVALASALALGEQVARGSDPRAALLGWIEGRRVGAARRLGIQMPAGAVAVRW